MSDDIHGDEPAEPTTDANVEPGEEPQSPPVADAVDQIDLTAIESDLDGVQAALARLADGTYRTDEVTGATLSDDLLTANPLARRA